MILSLVFYPHSDINFKIYVFKPINLTLKLVLFTYNIVLYLNRHKTISRHDLN